MKNGFSIIEMLVVLAIIAMLVVLAIPGIKAMQKSYDSTGAEGMIVAALSTARTLAISRGHYTGVRFQKAWKPTEDPLKAQQYMIFIIYLEKRKTENNLTCAFCPIEGYKPIKLPENMGVMDMSKITKDSDISSDPCVVDATAFSIIFSPAGKLVIHDVRTINKDGKSGDNSKDDVINSENNVEKNPPIGMFIQDDDSGSTIGLNKEQSRSKFVIYDCEKFSKLDPNKRYKNYLEDLKEKNTMHVNAYTGDIIKK